MSNRHRHTGVGQVPSHAATGAAGKAITAAAIPAIAVTPDGKTTCVASDGLAPVTPVRIVAIAGHR